MAFEKKTLFLQKQNKPVNKNLMRHPLPLLTFILALFVSNPAKSETLTATFDEEVGLPDGWQIVGNVTNNDDRGKDETASLWSNSKSLTDNYVVTEPVKGSLSFYWRSFGTSGSYPNGQILVYRYENDTLGERIWASATYKGMTWKTETVSLGDYQGRVAIALYSACIDDVTYTQADGEGGEQGGEGGEEKEPAPIMNINETGIAFGKVTEDTTHQVTISNTGDADLIVTISSNNSDFIVNPASLTITPDESETFGITFRYDAENVGSHTGVVTVTPNVGTPIEINVSARVYDPNAWSEDFSGNTLPEGWEADETGWSFADGVVHGAYAGYYDGYKHFLTTPALMVEKGDELEFQAKSTGSFSTIKITMSKDGGDFVNYENISLANNMTEFATYTIKGLQPGTYLFRFANDDYDLDNFSGLKPIATAHAAQITAVSIPEKGKQYVEYTASVIVKELAGQQEQLTAKFFIGDKQYGESIVDTLDGHDTKTFTVSFTPEEKIDGEAYFVVSNEDIALTSAKTTVSIEEEPTLSEDSGSLDSFENWGDYDTVTLNYTMKAGWNTLILPFAVNDLTIFGSDAVFYEFGECTNNSLKFKSVSTLYAQQPYLFYTKTEKDVFQFQNVTYFRTNSDPQNLQTTKNGTVFQGFYTPAEAGSLTGKYVLTDSETDFPKFEKATAETTMKGFRAYMEWTQPNMEIFLNEVNTGIRTIDDNTDATGRLYNLKGQRINPSTQHGIFIIRSAEFPQGKKVIK